MEHRKCFACFKVSVNEIFSICGKPQFEVPIPERALCLFRPGSLFGLCECSLPLTAHYVGTGLFCLSVCMCGFFFIKKVNTWMQWNDCKPQPWTSVEYSLFSRSFCFWCTLTYFLYYGLFCLMGWWRSLWLEIRGKKGEKTEKIHFECMLR